MEYDASWTPWSTTKTFTYSNLPDDVFTFRVKAKDFAGNIDSTPAQHTFTIDTTPPETTILTFPAPTINYTTVTFTWTGTDNYTPTNSLLYSYILQGYSTTWTPWTNSTTHTYTYLPNKDYTFKVKTLDQAGNSDPTPDEINFVVNVIDVSSPETIIISGPGGIIVQDELTYEWEGIDDISPPYMLVYSYILEGYSIDWAPWTNATTHTFYNLPDNTYTFKVKTQDLAGNSDPTPAEISCSIDTQPPITTLLTEGEKGDNGWYTSDVFISMNTSDNITGVAVTKYKIDNGNYQSYEDPFYITTEGNHTLNYFSTDNAGHQEQQRTIAIKIDKTPPVTTYTKKPENPTGNNGWYLGFVTVTLNRADSQSGTKGTMYRIDDGEWQTYSRPIYIENQGNHTLYYYSIDNAGNNENNKALQLKIDTINPSIDILSPKQGGLYISDRKITNLPYMVIVMGKVYISIHAVDNQSGIAEINFSIDGEKQYTDTKEPYEWIYKSEEIFFHKHTLSITAVDNAGNNETSLGMDIWTVFSV